jgi:hypothetical protein
MPTKTINPEDLAYFAAILDLKGSIIRKRNKMRATQQIVLSVESKNIRIIGFLASMTGTKPEAQLSKDVNDWLRKGCTEHCPEKHIHVNDQGYPWRMPAVSRWTVTGAGAAVVLHNVIPWLRTDRGLKEAMESILDQVVTTGQGWGATRASLRRLRDLGWQLPPEWEDLQLDVPGSNGNGE